MDFTHVPPVVANLAANSPEAADNRDFPDVETLLKKLAPGSHFNPYWLTVGATRAARSPRRKGGGSNVG